MASSGPGAAPGLDYKDYYAVLGVPRTASQADIKKAFRKLARQHHPDAKPGDTAAERRFKEINEANEVLSDPARRKQYDELGANWEAISRARQAGAAGGAGAPFGGFGGYPGGNVRYEFHTTADPGEFSDFFRMFFGEEAMGSAGGSPASGGRGSRPTGGTRLRRHPERDGHRRPNDRGPAQPARSRPVAAAHATRRRPRSRCPRRTTARPAWSRSTASGWRSRSRRVPTPGRGSSCPKRGPGGGDLIVVVQLTPDRSFVRRGADLERELPLTLEEALLGARGQGADAQGQRPARRSRPAPSPGGRSG